MRAQHLIRLLIEHQALKFGHYTTKSGRMSPYFMNFGAIATGSSLAELGSLYASCIANNFKGGHIHLIGPAYKGISLAVATAMQLEAFEGIKTHISYNRKEKKDHGEKGMWIGAPIQANSQVVLIDDILTGGTSMRELLNMLQEQNIRVTGAVVGIDRNEKGAGSQSARIEIEQEFKIKITSIANIDNVLDWCKSEQNSQKMGLDIEFYQQVESYRAKYGFAQTS